MHDYNERKAKVLAKLIVKWRKEGKVELAEFLRERLEKRGDLSYEEIDAFGK